MKINIVKFLSHDILFLPGRICRKLSLEEMISEVGIWFHFALFGLNIRAKSLVKEDKLFL